MNLHILMCRLKQYNLQAGIRKEETWKAAGYIPTSLTLNRNSTFKVTYLLKFMWSSALNPRCLISKD